MQSCTTKQITKKSRRVTSLTEHLRNKLTISFPFFFFFFASTIIIILNNFEGFSWYDQTIANLGMLFYSVLFLCDPKSTILTLNESGRRIIYYWFKIGNEKSTKPTLFKTNNTMWKRLLLSQILSETCQTSLVKNKVSPNSWTYFLYICTFR